MWERVYEQEQEPFACVQPRGQGTQGKQHAQIPAANRCTVSTENKEGQTVVAAEHHLDEGLHSSQGYNSFDEV